ARIMAKVLAFFSDRLGRGSMTKAMRTAPARPVTSLAVGRPLLPEVFMKSVVRGGRLRAKLPVRGRAGNSNETQFPYLTGTYGTVRQVRAKTAAGAVRDAGSNNYPNVRAWKEHGRGASGRQGSGDR